MPPSLNDDGVALQEWQGKMVGNHSGNKKGAPGVKGWGLGLRERGMEDTHAGRKGPRHMASPIPAHPKRAKAHG